MSRTFRTERPRTWRVREWFRADDHTRLRTQLADAAKEHNGSGSTDVDAQNWIRRVGVWCD